MDFMTVAAIVMGIGALAGVAMGVIKMIREMEYEDEYYRQYYQRPNQQSGYTQTTNRVKQPTHETVYAQNHRTPPPPMPTPPPPMPDQRVVENNMRYMQQYTFSTYNATQSSPSAYYHHNIDPVYAPITSNVGMNNWGFGPCYNTNWTNPQVMFQPQYPQHIEPTARNQQAVADMCAIMNKMRPNRPVSEDVIDCVLASVESNQHRYGNAPGLC
jgi:hypothetical protein